MKTRYIIEFFKFRPTDPAGFPIGVIMQGEGREPFYRALPVEFWGFDPDKHIPDRDYFIRQLVKSREKYMNNGGFDKVFKSARYDPEKGKCVDVYLTDPDYLKIIQIKEVYNLWYLPIKTEKGSPDKVAKRIVKLFKDEDYRRKICAEFIDSITPSDYGKPVNIVPKTTS